ncbi:FUSC family protein [Nonomuraea sp. NPDC048881]|uniref:FUSC family protein n=1 Tax=Nonomuraea sp. NPDC048881 TaxID=3155030 RepID=UPI0033CBC36D
MGASAGWRARLPVRAALRLGPVGDIWHKPALSAVVALAVPLLALLWAGRLDLVPYAAAGSMCALYGHGLPYAARARALAWVVLGMTSGTAVALVASALTGSVAVRVAVAALLAGLHKAVCDATRIGPPGNVVLTFVAAGAVFVPQELGDVPAHVGLGLLGGLLAWTVGMAPVLLRPDGPERIAVARALESTAHLLRTTPEPCTLFEPRALPETCTLPEARVLLEGRSLLSTRSLPGARGLVDGRALSGIRGLFEGCGLSETCDLSEARDVLEGREAAAVHQARHAAAAAVNAAWQTLLRSGVPARRRDALARLLVRAEAAAAGILGETGPGAARTPGLRGLSGVSSLPGVSGPPGPPGVPGTPNVPGVSGVPVGPGAPAASGAVRRVPSRELAGWARDLRKGRPLPSPRELALPADEWAELEGVAVERAESAMTEADRPGRAAAAGRVRRGAAGGGVRGSGEGVRGGTGGGVVRVVGEVVRRWRVVGMVSAGAAVAGWGSMALGVGRPYWAVVTAAAVFAANTTLSWSRAIQRVVGNLLGVGLFTLVAPVTRLGAVALVVAVLALQFATEAAITRNYWLGSVFVTPMAILMGEFAGTRPVAELVADRWLDTCLGAVAGLLACVLVPDRRAARRVRAGLVRLERMLARTPEPGDRDRLRAALVEVREAADVASGEWWTGALPHERIAAAERAGHRRLATLYA